MSKEVELFHYIRASPKFQEWSNSHHSPKIPLICSSMEVRVMVRLALRWETYIATGPSCWLHSIVSLTTILIWTEDLWYGAPKTLLQSTYTFYTTRYCIQGWTYVCFYNMSTQFMTLAALSTKWTTLIACALTLLSTVLQNTWDALEPSRKIVVPWDIFPTKSAATKDSSNKT